MCHQWMGTTDGWQSFDPPNLPQDVDLLCRTSPMVNKVFTGDLQKTLDKDNILTNKESEFTCDCPPKIVRAWGDWNSFELPDGEKDPIYDD